MPRTEEPPLSSWPRAALRWLAVLALLGAWLAAAAQHVELTSLQAERLDGALALEYHAKVALTPAVEDALKRGVPLHFVAQASVYRSRWYWRDERLARVSRHWRLSYQPLTASWRLSLGGLSQGFATLAEAMAPMTGVAGWRVLEGERLEPGERYYIDFSFQLDRSQLPQPMQIEFGTDWKLGIERTLRID